MNTTLIFEKTTKLFANQLEKNFYKLLFLTVGMFIIFRFRLFFFIVLFMGLDLLNSYLQQKYKFVFIPLDFYLMMIFFVSYTQSAFLGIVLSPFIIVTRIFLGKLEMRHFSKIPLLMITAIVAASLRGVNIVYAGIFIQGLRYTIEYSIQVVTTGKIELDHIGRRLAIFIGTIFFLGWFGMAVIVFV
jgi:hypothetical protein